MIYKKNNKKKQMTSNQYSILLQNYIMQTPHQNWSVQKKTIAKSCMYDNSCSCTREYITAFRLIKKK